jgi:hypothetical protein
MLFYSNYRLILPNLSTVLFRNYPTLMKGNSALTYKLAEAGRTLIRTLSSFSLPETAAG